MAENENRPPAGKGGSEETNSDRDQDNSAGGPLAIPLELQEREQWVEHRHKVPHHPAGRKASAIDPSTWASYQEATTMHPQFDGIGFVFTEDDPFCGLDFDNCITDGRLHPYVRAAIQKLDSYTDISPSGTGLHVIVEGKLNGHRNSTGKTPWGGKFEVYDKGRYFTMSGNHLPGTPTTTNERQAQLDEVVAELLPPKPRSDAAAAAPGTSQLDDDELLDKARKASTKFKTLFDDGDWRRLGYPSQSEADLAVCSLLAKLAENDTDQIDRLFRRSALMREEKWGDRPDYRERTLTAALQGKSDRHQEPPVEVNEPDGAGPANVATDSDKSGSDDGGSCDERPEIDASIGDLQEAASVAQRALREANEPPRYFTHGGLLARIELNDDGLPFTRSLDGDRLRHHLARAARYNKVVKGNNVDCRPPMDVVRDLLASPEKMWPRLRRIVGTPILAADGTLCEDVGYNAASESWYHPNGVTVSRMQHPTDIDVAQAADLLLEVICDFPFAGDADQAHTIALMVQPFVRELINGPTPMYLIEKPSPGTGATLLVQALLWPALGSPPQSFTEAGGEDEWRKRITAALRDAPEALLVENLHAKVNSAALAAVLTSREWGDRLLGVSEMVKLPVRCAWVATANNPQLSTEMVRRTVRIRMDAGMEHPWERPSEGFRHPELIEWVNEHRSELVEACLMLGVAWVAAGMPKGDGHLGMFESWASTMSGILEFAGIEGFLGNVKDFYEAMIVEDEGLVHLVELWWREFQGREVGAGDLFGLADEAGIDLGSGSERSQRTTFGHMLRNARDRRFGDRFIRSQGKTKGAAQWVLKGVGE